MSTLQSKSAFHGFWAAVVTALASIVVTTVVILFGQARGVIDSPAPTPTVTETVTVTPPPSGGDTQVTENDIYLDDLEPIEDELVSEAASFDGVDYPRSLTNPMASCSQVGPVAWVLPQGSDRLIAEVGVDVGAPEPQARVAFFVRVGAAPADQVYSETFSVGEHETMDVPVQPGRVEIETRFIPEGGFRGNCNTEAVAVWGDIRIRSGSD